MRPEKQLYFSINNMKSTLNSGIKLKSFRFHVSHSTRFQETRPPRPLPMPQNCPGEFCYPPGFQSAFKRLQDSRMRLIQITFLYVLQSRAFIMTLVAYYEDFILKKTRFLKTSSTTSHSISHRAQLKTFRQCQTA